MALGSFIDVVSVCEVNLHNVFNRVFDRSAFYFAKEGKNFIFWLQLFDFHIVARFLRGKGRWCLGKILAEANKSASAFFLPMV